MPVRMASGILSLRVAVCAAGTAYAPMRKMQLAKIILPAHRFRVAIQTVRLAAVMGDAMWPWVNIVTISEPPMPMMVLTESVKRIAGTAIVAMEHAIFSPLQQRVTPAGRIVIHVSLTVRSARPAPGGAAYVVPLVAPGAVTPESILGIATG